MTRLSSLVSTVLGLALAAAPAAAQQRASLPQFGLTAGISIPVGSLAETHVAGFAAGALAQYRAAGEALAVRGELHYESFAPKQTLDIEPKRAVIGTINVLYHVPGYDFRPYVIGGMGFYSLSGQRNYPGLNAGFGIDIPLTGLSAHLEARVHRALVDGPGYVTVPVTFGIKF